jgi:hypothetical protein
VVDLAGRHAVQVGLHHHREQRLIHPPAAFEQRREERSGAQLRDPQLQIARCGGQGAGAVRARVRSSSRAPEAAGGRMPSGGRTATGSRARPGSGSNPRPRIEALAA